MKNIFKSIALSLALCVPQTVNMFVDTAQAQPEPINKQLATKVGEFLSENVKLAQKTTPGASWLDNSEYSENLLTTGAELLATAHETNVLTLQDKFIEGNITEMIKHKDDGDFKSYALSLLIYKAYTKLLYNKNDFEQAFLKTGKTGNDAKIQFLFNEVFKVIADKTITCGNGDMSTAANRLRCQTILKQQKNNLYNDWYCYCVQANVLFENKPTQNSEVAKKKKDAKKENKEVALQPMETVIDKVLSYEEQLMRNGKLESEFLRVTDIVLTRAKTQCNKKEENAILAMDEKCRSLVRSLENNIFVYDGNADANDVVVDFAKYLTSRTQYFQTVIDDFNGKKFDDILFKFVINWLDAKVSSNKNTIDLYIDDLIAANISKFDNNIDNINNNYISLLEKMFKLTFEHTNKYSFRDCDTEVCFVFGKNGDDTDADYLICPKGGELGPLYFSPNILDKIKALSVDPCDSTARKQVFDTIEEWQKSIYAEFLKYTEALKGTESKVNYQLNSEQAEIRETLNAKAKHLRRCLLQYAFLNELKQDFVNKVSGLDSKDEDGDDFTLLK